MTFWLLCDGPNGPLPLSSLGFPLEWALVSNERYYVPKSLTHALVQAKNADQKFCKYGFHVINGKVQHAFIMGLVFPFGGRMLGNTFVCILQLGV
jgi:hypothetical protein